MLRLYHITNLYTWNWNQNNASLQNRQDRRLQLETPFMGRILPQARHACFRTRNLPANALRMCARKG